MESFNSIRKIGTLGLVIVLCFIFNSIVSIAFAAQVTLAWDPNREGNLAGYRVHIGTTSGSYSMHVDVRKVTTYTVTGLTEGQTYFFATTAYDTSGNESGYSNSVAHSVPVSGTTVDTDRDGLSDSLESGTYGTNPRLADTDGDGITDGQEVALWGMDWKVDIDRDGRINLLDWDADGDGLSDGQEITKGTSPGGINSSAAALPMETGEVMVGNAWKQVRFARKFLNPTLVVGGLGTTDSQASTVRTRNVTATGFEIRLQEWECYDGAHREEAVGYLAIESGVHTLSPNLKVEAGKFAFSKGGAFGYKPFQQIFPVAPVVLASVSTFNDPAAVEVALHQVSTKGLWVRLHEQERNVQDHRGETISYIAWQPSSGTLLGGMTFEVDQTLKVFDHGFKRILFSEPHTMPPVFLGQRQSYDGSDTCSVRWTGKNAEGVMVRLAEETSRDTEIAHVPEVMGYMAFSAKQ